MMITLKRFSILFLPLFFLACAEEIPKEKSYPEDLLIDSNGLFRNYELGVSPDSIKVIEGWTPAISNDSTLQFHETIHFGGDTVLIDVYLAFDAFGLFEVQVDLFVPSDSLSEVAMDHWSETLTSSFGDYDKILFSRQWTTFSEANNVVEITLSQERNDENQPFVSLNYLEPLDDEF